MRRHFREPSIRDLRAPKEAAERRARLLRARHPESSRASCLRRLSLEERLILRGDGYQDGCTDLDLVSAMICATEQEGAGLEINQCP